MATSVDAPRSRLALWQALVLLTLLFGLALRWNLASPWLDAVGLRHEDVRHAHSHVGFYGVLTVGWWLLSERAGRAVMGGRAVLVFMAVVVLATALFAAYGYVVPTIALSTVVAGYWLVAGWRLWRGPARAPPGDWLALAPVGLALGVLLVPAIAVSARHDLGLSRELAHVFIGVLLLATFVPVALSTLAVPRFEPVAYGLAAVVGTTYLVFHERLPWPLGLFLTLTGLALAHVLRGLPREAPPWLRLAWWGLALGLVVLGVAPPLQTEAVRLAALHYTVLGPLLLTLVHRLLPARPRAHPIAFPLALAALAAMLAGMVGAPVIGAGAAAQLAAWSGSLLVPALGWVVVSRGRAP
ncbi:MAG: hypothetical protein U1F43_04940 [Myxococcota bacterium]